MVNAYGGGIELWYSYFWMKAEDSGMFSYEWEEFIYSDMSALSTEQRVSSVLPFL